MNLVGRIPDRVKTRNVLVSVSDKTGIEDFVAQLVAISPGITVYSTGGTYKVLRGYLESFAGGKHVGQLRRISDYTGQPEMQGGLVKTLDYRIYLGLLSEPFNPAHKEDINRVSAQYFDMVVVNLYPFGDKIAGPDIGIEDARSHIDIGGPTMLRASAKNYIRVASVCDPGDYSTIISRLRHNNGSIELSLRFELAKKTFAHTAEYDNAISDYLRDIMPEQLGENYQLESEVWR